MNYEWPQMLQPAMEQEIEKRIANRLRMKGVPLFRKTAREAVETIREQAMDCDIASRDVNRYVSAILNADRKVFRIRQAIHDGFAAIASVKAWRRAQDEPWQEEFRPHVVPLTDDAEAFILWHLNLPCMDDRNLFGPMATNTGWVLRDNGKEVRAFRFKRMPREELSRALCRVQDGYGRWLVQGRPPAKPGEKVEILDESHDECKLKPEHVEKLTEHMLKGEFSSPATKPIEEMLEREPGRLREPALLMGPYGTTKKVKPQ
jgi:hypothetical protein